MDLSTKEGRRIQGERIKRAARDAGLSIDELAVKIGCSRALIYQYVSGASLAQTDRLQQIAEALNKPLTWFFVDDESTVQPVSQPTDRPSIIESADPDHRIHERVQQLRTLMDAYANPADWRKVTDTCQQLIPLLQYENNREQIADVLFSQGNALVNLNELGLAKEKLNEAASLYRDLNDSENVLCCLQSLGQVNVMMGRTEEAIHQFLQIYESDAGLPKQWNYKWQGALSLGAAYEVLGDYALAAEYLTTALEIVEQNEPQEQSPLLGESQIRPIAHLYIDANWANLELDWGDYRDAAEKSNRCVHTAQRLGIQDQYIEALLTRGMALYGLCDYAGALEEIQRAVNVSQLTRDQQRWSIGLSIRSLVYSSCMRIQDAVSDGKEALAIALRHGASRAEMLAQQALSQAYILSNNSAEAVYHIRQAIAVANSLRLKLQSAQFTSMLSALELMNGNIDSAKKTVNVADELARVLQSKPIQYECMLIKARIALNEKQYNESTQLALEAIHLSDHMECIDKQWHPYYILAAGSELSEPIQTRKYYETAISKLQNIRLSSREAVGVDAILENIDALELWRHWLLYCRSHISSEEANKAALEADWPPLMKWLDEMKESDQENA